MALKNGQLPASALALIPGTSRYIAADLLPQVIALRAAFQAHFGKPLVITDGYRSLAGQVAARERYEAGKGAYAVRPGTSNHGMGRAIDFGSRVNILGTPEHDWMVANAPRFGFVWLKKAGNGSIEPWHFDGSVVPVSNYVGIGGSVPQVDVPDEIADIVEKIMSGTKIISVTDGRKANYYSAPSGKFLALPDEETRDVVRAAYDTEDLQLNARQVDVLQAFAARLRAQK